MSARLQELLRAAQRYFEDQQMIDHAFLVEHDVSFDEMVLLIDQLAFGASIAVWMFDEPKLAIQLMNRFHLDGAYSKFCQLLADADVLDEELR